MKYFTRQQIEEIRRQLATLGVRDTDLPEAHELTGAEKVAIVQDGVNRITSITDLYSLDNIEEIIGTITQGKSAYQIWLDEGHTGEPDDFLEWLKGEKGDKGDKGDTGSQGPKGNNGTNGTTIDTVVVNVDSNTGTPSGTGSVSGSTLTINLHNLKGESGGGGGDTTYTAGAGIDITSNTISVKSATTSELGGIMVGNVVASTTINSASSAEGKNYPLQINGNGLAFVNVPWSGGGGTGGGAGYLYELGDVDSTMSSPNANDVLSYVGGKWIGVPRSEISTDLTALTGRVTTLENKVGTLETWKDTINWFTVVTVNGESTLKLNPTYKGLWAEGWISAGGIGSGNSGGSGGSGGSGYDYLYQLLDTEITNPTNGDVLTYSGATWVNTSKSSFLNGYLTQSTADGRYLALSGGTLTGRIEGTNWSIEGSGSSSGNASFRKVSIKGGTQNEILLANGTTLSTSSLVTSSQLANGVKNPNSLKFSGSNKTYNGESEVTITAADLNALTANNIHTLSVQGGAFGSNFTYDPTDSDATLNIPKTTAHITHTSGTFTSGTLGYFLEHLGDSYVTISTDQEISGAKIFKTKDVTLNNVSLVPATTGTGSVGSATKRFGYIYADFGAFDEDVSIDGDLTLTGSSHIDIGPLRLEYDSTNKALHITKKSNSDANNYGIYADGFVSAGGVA